MHHRRREFLNSTMATCAAAGHRRRHGGGHATLFVTVARGSSVIPALVTPDGPVPAVQLKRAESRASVRTSHGWYKRIVWGAPCAQAASLCRAASVARRPVWAAPFMKP